MTTIEAIWHLILEGLWHKNLYFDQKTHEAIIHIVYTNQLPCLFFSFPDPASQQTKMLVTAPRCHTLERWDVSYMPNAARRVLCALHYFKTRKTPAKFRRLLPCKIDILNGNPSLGPTFCHNNCTSPVVTGEIRNYRVTLPLFSVESFFFWFSQKNNDTYYTPNCENQLGRGDPHFVSFHIFPGRVGLFRWIQKVQS